MDVLERYTSEAASLVFTLGADTVALPLVGGTFNALGGDDVLSYRGGFITADGGAGSDTLDFAAFGSAVYVDLARTDMEVWTRDRADVSAAGGTWRAIGDISHLENLVGTAHSDKLYGDADNNRFAYNGGFDVLDGRGGTDTADFSLFGSAVYVDLARTGSGDNEAWTRDGGDVNPGPGTWRAIADLANVENLVGTVHSDKLYGDGNNNTFFYNGGFDLLDGRGGTDTADFSLFSSAVYVDLARTGSGDNEAWTRDRADVDPGPGTWRALANMDAIENVTGTAQADRLLGNDSANQLQGGAGNDTLTGRGGNDVLWGGAGADRFVFGASSGFDTMRDFNPAEGDRLVLSSQSYVLRDTPDGVALDLSGGGTVLMSDHTVASFSASWIVG
jgi:Ca2+-binding RTX toxin-like protein